MSTLLSTVARKFPEIKICDIEATRCIENYPESNCPTFIIYHKTNVIKQYITLTQLGGNDAKLKDIERVLVDVDAVDVNDKRLDINQQDEDLEDERRMRFTKKSIRGRQEFDNDDDDDDFYD